jgi:DNA processing protein
MPESSLLYLLALSCVPGIGPVYAKKLLHHFGNARDIFKADSDALSSVAGIGAARANAIVRFDQFAAVEKELAFIQRNAIRCLYFEEEDYPQRLRQCNHSPVLLFYKGTTDLNAGRVISVVGSRAPSEYGKQAAQRLIMELSAYGPLVISGLAFGIDAVAHKAALAYSLPTVAVLGHGLDQIYPQEHRPLAAKIIKQGGLLTTFSIHNETTPKNFPLRNRIVAGMCDALVVVETDTDGGSMLTAENARSCKKKVFAFPGRITDRKSRGCNQLIRQGDARLMDDASQLVTELGWNSSEGPVRKQASMFPSPSADLAENEKDVLHLFKEDMIHSFDELAGQLQLSHSMIALSLTSLEVHGWISSLPGRRYRRTNQ